MSKRDMNFLRDLSRVIIENVTFWDLSCSSLVQCRPFFYLPRRIFTAMIMADVRKAAARLGKKEPKEEGSKSD
jgi:hypothetical protein